MKNNLNLFGGGYLDNDYITSLCVQWSLEFTKNDIIKYVCEAEDLPIEIRRKINKMYVRELNNVNERTIKDYDFVEQMNHIYVISKIIILNKDIPDFIGVIHAYSNENDLDFTDFLDITNELHYSSIELASKYWK